VSRLEAHGSHSNSPPRGYHIEWYLALRPKLINTFVSLHAFMTLVFMLTSNVPPSLFDSHYINDTGLVRNMFFTCQCEPSSMELACERGAAK
jgi:hypothetical protein